MEDIKRSLRTSHKSKSNSTIRSIFGTKYQPGEDVGIFISRVKTAATRLQEAGHKLRWLPQEFQSTVQQIYRWKEEDFRVVKIEAELILEANRLQLMKQDLEKAENAYLSSFTSKKSKTLPGATAAAHGDPNGKNDYQKKSGKVFNCKTIKNVKQSIKTIGPCYVCNKYGHLKVNCKEKKSLQKSPSTVNETFNTEFDKGLCNRYCCHESFCNDKSLFLDLKPITNMKMSLATEDKSCPVEGIGTLRFRFQRQVRKRPQHLKNQMYLPIIIRYKARIVARGNTRATRRLLVMDFAILNHDQMMRTVLQPPTPHQRRERLSLGMFNALAPLYGGSSAVLSSSS
ncbi:retrovirus-related Pol polyprotein from transposon TNT 1-94 [Trichonephila clavipes]|nr:retrovirus-related Pol polyprotein from transposon TNT 1-94 [Trichonephila clavipes]